jgi:nucleolar protein 56
MKLIYSNLTGVHVFNEKYDVIEKKLFSEKELVSKNIALKNGEWLIEEEKFIEKYSKDKPIFLGFKKKNVDGIDIVQDINKLRRISLKEDIWQPNFTVSSQDLKNSFKQDILIIQAIRAYDDVDRIFNTLSMRIRDWYNFYLPEISRQIESNEEFIEKALQKDQKDAETVGFIEGKADIDEIKSLAKLAKTICEKKKEIESYIEGIMKKECANILGVAGALLGAKLISLAGSIEELAKMPYTTLQLLGAEKALFWHLRTKKNCPKHGVIIAHPIVAGSRNKGKAARSVAEELSIAARVDFFKGQDISAKLNEKLKKKMQNEKN